MAVIQARKNKKGTTYQVLIRANDGHPPAYKNFPTKQEAKDWAKLEEARRLKETYFPDQAKRKHTLTELGHRYIEEVLPSKPKNAKDTKRHIEWWIKKIGKYSLSLISYDLIDKYRKELINTPTEHGGKRNPATVNRYMSSLSVVFTFALKQLGWIKENPMFRFTKLKESKGRKRLLSLEECDRLLESCRQSKNKCLYEIVVLAIVTGMRQSEILGLTWDCFDFENKIILLKDTKNGSDRPAPLLEALHAFFYERYQKKLPHQILVFPGRSGLKKISIRKAWDEALKRANISGLHFHSLRHAYCSYLSQNEVNPVQIAKATGHQTIEMLLRYVQEDPSFLHKLSQFVYTKLINKQVEDGQK
jgi:integrase